MGSAAARRPGGPSASYVRISVRALIIMVLTIGGGLGLVVRQSQTQRDAVAAITKAGGIVQYDWEKRSSGPKSAALVAEVAHPMGWRRLLRQCCSRQLWSRCNRCGPHPR